MRDESQYEHFVVIIVQIILSKAIVDLSPDFFWLGGGEVDLKLGIQTSQFIDLLNPFIVDVS